MVVGILRMTLAVPESEWSDTKKSVVKKLITRTRAQFNVAVAEVEDADVAEHAVMGIVAVGNDHCVVNSVLDKVVTFVEELYLAEIEDYSVELMHV